MNVPKSIETQNNLSPSFVPISRQSLVVVNLFSLKHHIIINKTERGGGRESNTLTPLATHYVLLTIKLLDQAFYSENIRNKKKSELHGWKRFPKCSIVFDSSRTITYFVVVFYLLPNSPNSFSNTGGLRIVLYFPTIAVKKRFSGSPTIAKNEVFDLKSVLNPFFFLYALGSFLGLFAFKEYFTARRGWKPIWNQRGGGWNL